MEVIDFFLLWLEVFLTIVQTEETRASYVCRYVNPEYSIKIWRFFFLFFFKNFIQITMVLLFIFVFSCIATECFSYMEYKKSLSFLGVRNYSEICFFLIERFSRDMCWNHNIIREKSRQTYWTSQFIPIEWLYCLCMHQDHLEGLLKNNTLGPLIQ